MAIDKEKLASIISGKARAMCTPDYDRKITEVTNIRHGRPTNNTQYYDPDPASFNDYQEYDKMYLTESEEYSEANDMNYSYSDIQNSKLPDAIKESFAKQRIDVTGAGGLSVLDGMNVKTNKRQNPQQQVIREQVIPASNNVSGVDYSIIKAIVNECLKEHFEKQTLNESTSLKTIALKEGTISLVDNKGNVYKAKLEKIGNKNDKN